MSDLNDLANRFETEAIDAAQQVAAGQRSVLFKSKLEAADYASNCFVIAAALRAIAGDKS